MTQPAIGRYEIQKELGRGGMAVVYLARDPYVNRWVAVKALPRQLTIDPKFRTRFQQEAQLIATLEHPAIVPVYDFGAHDDQPFIVMRYMPGGSLNDRLTGGPLSIAEAAALLQRIGAALDHVHRQGVIHRDLKPANILFDQYGYAFITDFGIAKMVQTSATMTGVAIGTPEYMSPEQARAVKKLDGRSDIYALGVVLFQALSGQLPYKADTPMGIAVAHVTEPVPSILKVRPDLPPGCEAVIAQAMAKDPEQRFATVTELTEALFITAGNESLSSRQQRQITSQLSTPLPLTPVPKPSTPLPSQPSYGPSKTAPPLPPTELLAPESSEATPSLPPTELLAPESSEATSPLPPTELPAPEPSEPTAPGSATPIPFEKPSQPETPATPPVTTPAQPETAPTPLPDEARTMSVGVALQNMASARQRNLTPNLNRANLQGANLGGVDLSEASLCEINLSRTNLHQANLRHSNLTAANLSEACLVQVNLSGANLSEASLIGANLSNAKLHGANLSKAGLVGANLNGVHLGWANLNRAVLSWADLSGANLTGVNLQDTTLDHLVYTPETRWPKGFKPPEPVPQATLIPSAEASVLPKESNIASLRGRQDELEAVKRQHQAQWQLVFENKEARQQRERLQKLLRDLAQTEHQDFAIYQIVKMGTETIDSLAETLENNINPKARYNSARALGKMYQTHNLTGLSKTRVIKGLVQALSDSNAIVRYEAAGLLGLMKGPIAVEPLGTLLKDQSKKVREQARRSLKQIGGERAQELLSKPQGFLDWLMGS